MNERILKLENSLDGLKRQIAEIERQIEDEKMLLALRTSEGRDRYIVREVLKSQRSCEDVAREHDLTGANVQQIILRYLKKHHAEEWQAAGCGRFPTIYFLREAFSKVEIWSWSLSAYCSILV